MKLKNIIMNIYKDGFKNSLKERKEKMIFNDWIVIIALWNGDIPFLIYDNDKLCYNILNFIFIYFSKYIFLINIFQI